MALPSSATFGCTDENARQREDITGLYEYDILAPIWPPIHARKLCHTDAHYPATLFTGHWHSFPFDPSTMSSTM